MTIRRTVCLFVLFLLAGSPFVHLPEETSIVDGPDLINENVRFLIQSTFSFWNGAFFARPPRDEPSRH
jgi:hypothetical protein